MAVVIQTQVAYIFFVRLAVKLKLRRKYNTDTYEHVPIFHTLSTYVRSYMYNFGHVAMVIKMDFCSQRRFAWMS